MPDLYPGGLDRRKRAALGMVFTEKLLADFIVDRALAHLDKDFFSLSPKVVEPSVGGGAFCLALLEKAKKEIEKTDRKEKEKQRLLTSFAEGMRGVDVEKAAATLAVDNLRRAEAKLGLQGFDWKSRILVKDFLGTERSDFDAEKGVSLIIGNPPYIGEKGSKELFHRMRETKFGSRFYEKGMDYFYYFIEKGLELLAEDGILAYITTSYWTRADSAGKLREYIRSQAGFAEVIDFQDIRLFEDAQGHNSLVFILKKGYRGSFLHYRVLAGKKKLQEVFEQIPAAEREILRLQNPGDPKSEKGQEGSRDVLAGEISGQIGGLAARKEGPAEASLFQTLCCDNETTTRLTPYFIFLPREEVSFIRRLQELSERNLDALCSINQGIVSGADRVTGQNIRFLPKEPLLRGEIRIGEGIFVLSQEEKERLCERLGSEREEIVPFYKSSSVQPYRLQKHSQYLIYLEGSEGEDHPLVREHLSRYRALLERRREAVRGKIPYYALHWKRRRGIFTGEKLLVPQRALRPTFAYSEEPVYASADVYFINQMQKDPFFLLAYLGSGIVERYLHYLGKRKGSYHELYSKPLGEIPVPSLPFCEEAALADLARSVHSSSCPKERKRLLSEIDERLWQVLKYSPGISKKEGKN
ncbi:MAG: TaqI-like C-terminal specificity domain-containing protein [Peptostreptococcaceae bacterium]|nr:TaqI-like C-terminal specificity domain-containing protein [Peptostreptococcaceae bacterium]